ncbi:hypothetical protein IT568_13440 [bacterium]|nr:hypothetical protein [bacterium]
MKITHIFLAFLFFTRLQAQEVVLEKNFGERFDELGKSLIETKEGFVSCGYKERKGTGKTDFYVVKFDKNFSVVWEKFWGKEGTDYTQSLVYSKDGNLIVCGYTNSFGFGANDVFVAKLSFESGEIVWEKTFGTKGNDVGNSVCETKDGNFIVCGTSENQVYALKFTPEGELVWEKFFSKNVFGNSVLETSEEKIVIFGQTQAKGVENTDALVLVLDKNGNLLVEKNFGGEKKETANFGIETKDGNFVFCGGTTSKGLGNFDFWIVKSDKNLNTIWEQNYGSDKWESSNCVVETSDKGFSVVGGTQFESESQSTDFWILKLDENGELVWEKTYGKEHIDSANFVLETKDGFLVVCGFTELSHYGNYQLSLVKIK